MSTFLIEGEIIQKVEPAKNSDFLDLVTLEGKDYSFITQKDLYKPGQEVVYFPIDSLLPMWLVEGMNLQGRLAWGNLPEGEEERLQNRVKTVRLRGNISQGLVCSKEDLREMNPNLKLEGKDLAEELGVTKYSPPEILLKEGNLSPLPDMVDHYDIENLQNHLDIYTSLLDTEVFISEKIEGSHFWISLDENDEISVGQRNYQIREEEGRTHSWVKTSMLLREKIKAVKNYLFSDGLTSIFRLTFRGEIIGPGIQGNYYGLKNHEILLFEIELNGKPLDAKEFLSLCNIFDLPIVPVLVFGETLRELGEVKTYSNGSSRINTGKLREGIVVKPTQEYYKDGFGRVILKVRSPEYLAKSDL